MDTPEDKHKKKLKAERKKIVNDLLKSLKTKNKDLQSSIVDLYESGTDEQLTESFINIWVDKTPLDEITCSENESHTHKVYNIGIQFNGVTLSVDSFEFDDLVNALVKAYNKLED